MASFKLGDTVKLKSGGPLMTVIEDESKYVTCQWFLSNGTINQGSFPPEALEIGTQKGMTQEN